VEHLGETRLAHGARADQLPDLPVGGGLAQVVVRAQHHAGPAAGIDHLPRLGDREGQRLLAQHVLAGRCCLDRLRPVHLVRGADIHGADLGIANQGGEARVGARDPVARRVPGASLRIGAEHRHHLVVGHRPDRVDHPLVRDGARPTSPQPSDLVMSARGRGPSGGAPGSRTSEFSTPRDRLFCPGRILIKESNSTISAIARFVYKLMPHRFFLT